MGLFFLLTFRNSAAIITVCSKNCISSFVYINYKGAG